MSIRPSRSIAIKLNKEVRTFFVESRVTAALFSCPEGGGHLYPVSDAQGAGKITLAASGRSGDEDVAAVRDVFTA